MHGGLWWLLRSSSGGMLKDLGGWPRARRARVSALGEVPPGAGITPELATFGAMDVFRKILAENAGNHPRRSAKITHCQVDNSESEPCEYYEGLLLMAVRSTFDPRPPARGEGKKGLCRRPAGRVS